MTNLDEQIDKVVDELWKISEPYPTYSIRATKAIKALIANQVREARINELEKAITDTPKQVEYDTITKQSVGWYNIHDKYVDDRIAELKGDDK